MKAIKTDQAPPAVGFYSQGIEVDGLIFFSGQIGFTPRGEFVGGSVEDQTVQVLKNLDGLLNGSGLNRKNVVKCTIFLQDINDFEKVNTLYAGFFHEHLPARSCVEVAAIPKGALVEIEMIAKR